ncbi:PEP-CTERM sorting domain-containing protein [Massilia phosphatilytica]
MFSNFSGGVSAFGGQFFASDVTGQFVVTVTSRRRPPTAARSPTMSRARRRPRSSVSCSTSPLTSVTLATDGGAYWPTANNVVLAVPEPATYGTTPTGIGLLGLMARRRRG